MCQMYAERLSRGPDDVGPMRDQNKAKCGLQMLTAMISPLTVGRVC